MKASIYAFTLALLAGVFSSCIGYTEDQPPMMGFNQREVYNRGFADGSSDRISGRAHNPHINDAEDLSSAYRKHYIWGYTEGYKDPSGARAKCSCYSAK